MMGAINRDGLCEALQIPERYSILLVIALGKPNEEVVLEKVGGDGQTDYWRDEKHVHHVPKRALDELIIGPGSLIGHVTPLNPGRYSRTSEVGSVSLSMAHHR